MYVLIPLWLHIILKTQEEAIAISLIYRLENWGTESHLQVLVHIYAKMLESTFFC